MKPWWHGSVLSSDESPEGTAQNQEALFPSLAKHAMHRKTQSAQNDDKKATWPKILNICW